MIALAWILVFMSGAAFGAASLLIWIGHPSTIPEKGGQQ